MKHRVILFALSIFLCSITLTAQETPKPTEEILQEAYKQAAKEHKKVFVIFHASWCGWCHRMDSLMNNPACKKMFTDNYVIKHLVIYESKDKKNLENPGSEDLIKKYHGDKGGIPFWLIFDASGKLLADSKLRPEGMALDAEGGDNVGCPSEKKEVDLFVKILKQTTTLKQDQISVIENIFTKK